MPGKSKVRGITKTRVKAYEAIKKEPGVTKATAAKIANAGKTKAGRSKMATKAAATRKKKG